MTKRLREFQCSTDGENSSIESNTPEKVVDIINGENTLTIRERLDKRRKLNKSNHRLIEREEDVDHISSRYELQKFNNGGQEYDEEKNEVKFTNDEGPSQYERSRIERLEKGLSKRIKDLNTDRKLSSRGRINSYESWLDKYGELDSQIDSFLYNFMQDREDL